VIKRDASEQVFITHAARRDTLLANLQTPLAFDTILFHSKRLPLLIYGLEACSLSKSDLSSTDFASNRFFMKLFKMYNNIQKPADESATT